MLPAPAVTPYLEVEQPFIYSSMPHLPPPRDRPSYISVLPVLSRPLEIDPARGNHTACLTSAILGADST